MSNARAYNPGFTLNLKRLWIWSHWWRHLTKNGVFGYIRGTLCCQSIRVMLMNVEFFGTSLCGLCHTPWGAGGACAGAKRIATDKYLASRGRQYSRLVIRLLFVSVEVKWVSLSCSNGESLLCFTSLLQEGNLYEEPIEVPDIRIPGKTHVSWLAKQLWAG